MEEANTRKAEGVAGASLVVAADLGGTNLRAATVDSQGRIHERVKVGTPKAADLGQIVGVISAAARELERRAAGVGAEVRAVSVAVPGTVRAESGIVMKAPNVPSLNGANLASALETELHRPALIENDANAAAVGEMWQGAGRGRATIICLTLGTGVGGGIILDRKLWRGIDGSAGELGHLAVEPFGGEPCACGARGCIEVYASATAIARMAREGLAGFPDSALHAAGELTAEAVYRAGLGGDRLALEVFARMGECLGACIAGLVNIFNPEMVVVGGGAAGGWDLFAPRVREEVNARAFPIPARRVEIVRAERGDDAGLLGAAHIAFESMRKDG